MTQPNAQTLFDKTLLDKYEISNICCSIFVRKFKTFSLGPSKNVLTSLCRLSNNACKNLKFASQKNVLPFDDVTKHSNIFCLIHINITSCNTKIGYSFKSYAVHKRGEMGDLRVSNILEMSRKWKKQYLPSAQLRPAAIPANSSCSPYT